MKNIYLFLPLFLISCGTQISIPKLPNIKSMPVEALALATKTLFSSYTPQQSLNKKKEIALQGLAYSGACLKQVIKADCLYYDALHRGKYYEVHVLGYETGLKKMVDSLKLLIQIGESYDFAGAHRVLSEIYSQAPSFGNRKDAITQDDELALYHIKEAYTLYPAYSLNALLYAKQLLQSNPSLAKTVFKEYLKNKDPRELNKEYPEFQKIEDKIRKKLKSL